MEDLEISQVMGPQFEYIDKFIRKYVMFWIFKMEITLKARDLWGIIDEETKPKVTIIVALVTYEKKENCALNLIVQSLSNG